MRRGGGGRRHNDRGGGDGVLIVERTGKVNIMTKDKGVVVSMIEEVEKAVSITGEVEIIDLTEEDKDPAASTMENKDLDLQMMDNKRQDTPYTPDLFQWAEEAREVPQMTPAEAAEEAKQDQIDAAERKRITKTANIGLQRNDGPHIGEVAEIVGLQSAQEWETNTILMWRKQTEGQKW
ncbi:hypothetical protein MMC17_001739 [Xylographa soralifera]|nr:hypothetical protein [Xylographa soralifera]